MNTTIKNSYITIENKKYLKNIEAVKISNRWVPKELTTLDTFTNLIGLKSKLTPYVNLENTVSYTSKLIHILIKNKTIPFCESITNIYKENFINHPFKDDVYLLLGENYDFSPRSKFSPKTKVYSVSDSSDEINTYTELENNLSFLNKYTFGIELETSGIPLKKKEVLDLGFYELYDGSINGPEYASGIMNYKNFHHLDFFLNLLKTISYHDHTCSLHIHVGNVDYNENNLCAIYSLFQRLQEDLNLLIAPYKKDYRFLYNKQKDHCQNLPLIPALNENSIKDLFKIPYSTNLSDYLSRTSKWNLSGRYYTVNFLNYICKDVPNKTIELRSLQMTFNYDYVITWLIINTAIIDYAINNNKKVLDKKEKIQIEDVLSNFIPDSIILKNVLDNYYNIKNIIYSKKFLENDTSTNSMSLDKHINTLKPIIPSIIKNNIDIKNKLSTINLNILKEEYINSIDLNSCISLGPLKLQLQGFYSEPDESFCDQLIFYIAKAIKVYNKLDYNVNYIIPNGNIQCTSSKLFIDDKIVDFCIISKGILYYVVKSKDKNIITSIPINHFHNKNDDYISMLNTDFRTFINSTYQVDGSTITNEEE